MSAFGLTLVWIGAGVLWPLDLPTPRYPDSIAFLGAGLHDELAHLVGVGQVHLANPTKHGDAKVIRRLICPALWSMLPSQHRVGDIGVQRGIS
jgi:hypothetical protein